MIKFCKQCQTDTERNANGRCRPCTRAYSAASRARNPGAARASDAKWRAANPEKARALDVAKSARYRVANPEKVRQRYASYRARNPDKVRAYNAAYKAENVDTLRVARAAWAAANTEKRRINEHNRRARKSEVGGKLSSGLADKLFKLQKGKCPCCNQPLGDDFHMDHIQPLALGGPNTDGNMQLLRQRCNNQKHAKDPIDFMQSRGFLL